MIPYPSVMGSLFILLGFALYVVSMQSVSGLLLLVLGVLFGAYVINAYQAVQSCRHLRFQPPPVITCTEGEALEGAWKIQNSSTTVIGHATVASHFGELFRVGAILPGNGVHIIPELSLPERGVYPLRSLKVVSTYPFGLIKCERLLRLDGEIVVYPAVYDCEPPLAAGFEPMVGGRFKGRNRSAAGDSFHGVRPLLPSDPVKLIHWPSSSKGLGVMVREFDEELSGRVGLIMDSTPAGTAGGEKLLDWAARAAGSLVLAALEAGHQVEFIRLGDREALSLPPFGDGELALAALARLEPRKHARNTGTLEQAVARLPLKASVCLVLTGLNDEVVELVHKQLLPARRKVAVCLPATCRQAAEELSVPVAFFGAREMT